MLAYYAGVFPTVEINYSFYRLPSEKSLATWAASTPDRFRFSLKAPRRLTHHARLHDCQELLDAFCRLAATLGAKLGVLLFQLPPFFRRNTAVLERFLDGLPAGARAAFEFRHASWFEDEVFDALRARNAALCLAESDRLSTPVVPTATYGYLRLRDEGYQDSDLARWAGVVTEQALVWREAFVYFKHESAGKGPEFARRFTSMLPGSEAPLSPEGSP
jgi:uncharacterized protein YecE (DUF72 family)